MSEALLKAILRLFAIVAKEGEVTQQEREQIGRFLEEHLSHRAVTEYLALFDEYSISAARNADDAGSIEKLCEEINAQLTQKQKAVIILDLMSIIEADGTISPREEQLLHTVGRHLKIDDSEIDAIEAFVLGRDAHALDHDGVLIIDNSPAATFQRAHHLVRPHLNGLIAVLYLEQTDLFFIKYVGNTDVFLNGVPVRPGKIAVLGVGSLLRWDKDDPVYYGQILNKFKTFGDHSRTSFEATNISFKFKNGRLGLRNVNVLEESGNLVALMGGSGAGKSTLLHVLNGTEKPSEGKVLINGIDIHAEPEKIEGVIGFVPQDDLLIEDLTVYQNLYYAAKLCFNDKTEEEIDQLVMRVLEDLGLAEIKDLKVGSPLQKTISGGQRKRLNIGLELLREPAVLFCDEPTSGLSSRDSENIIDLLKELSLKGKLVFAVIHQPSSDIFKMFDKLLILDNGGYQIYYGNPVDAIIYFKRCINMVNSEEGECHQCGNVNPEQIFNIIETRVINEYGHFTNERKMSPEQWYELFRKHYRPKDVAPATEEPHSTLRIPSRLKQAHLFSLRDIQAKLHNRQYIIINLLEAPVLAFILAFIVRYFNVDDQAETGYIFSKNPNLPAYLFMSVIVALFMGLTVSAEEIIRDRKILKREAFLHLSRCSYILSKISILFMLSAIQTFLYVLVGSSILEIKGLFLEHWFILFTTSCFANLLGLNISSAFNSAVTIYILIPLLLIPQLILSGVVVKFDKLNPVIGNTATVPLVGDLMASRWAFEASMVTQFKDNEYEREFYVWDKMMAGADFKKLYYIPQIETRLQYCLNNMHSTDSAVQAKMSRDLDLVRTELDKEFTQSGIQPVSDLQRLRAGGFDSTAYQRTLADLEKLRDHYTKIFNKAEREKEAYIRKMTDTPEKETNFITFRDQHHNESITELVKNSTERNRIVESNGRLIQKIYPIYKDPDPEHLVDFDAQFYMPRKHFLSKDIDTFWFNTGVIWSMTLVLAGMLYFDVLRRIIDGIGEVFTNPMNRRK